MVDEKFRDFMDIRRMKLRTSENHQSQWTTIKEIATMLQKDEYDIMKKAYAFELHITANVTSIKSRINTDTAQSFIKYILTNPS